MSNSWWRRAFLLSLFLSHLLWGEGWVQMEQRLRPRGPPLVQTVSQGWRAPTLHRPMQSRREPGSLSFCAPGCHVPPDLSVLSTSRECAVSLRKCPPLPPCPLKQRGCPALAMVRQSCPLSGPPVGPRARAEPCSGWRVGAGSRGGAAGACGGGRQVGEPPWLQRPSSKCKSSEFGV